MLAYIYTYVSKFDWFWYDFGMMVWMWYDCMTSVWWCDSFVCECCECIQIEEIAKKCKTKNRLKEPQKISLTFKFFCNISPNTATRGFPEDLWRLEENVFSSDLVCLRVSLCIYWRPWRAKVLFFISLYQRNIQILKSLQGLQEHHEHTHNKTKTRVKTSSRRSSDFTLRSSGSSGTRAANRAHLDSTKFLFSSKYFSQAKVPEKYGSQEIQS